MSDSSRLSRVPQRLGRLSMQGWSASLGQPLRAAERELERLPVEGKLLDLTYADTHRFPPAAWVLEEFTKAANGSGMTYTPYAGDEGVREAVAENVHKAFGLVAERDEVLLTPGTQGALFTALASLVEAGDEVLLADPEYLSTERMLAYFKAKVSHIPLHRDDSGTASFDLHALRAAAERQPALLVFSNPNNPTGGVHSRASLEAVAEVARAHDIPVLVDQLYCRLLYDGTELHDLASFPRMRERTVTLLGPSKTESLSGYRIGVAIAPAGIVERMEDVLSVAALRAPAYAQHILARWLIDDQDLVARRIGEYQALRDMAIGVLGESEHLEVTPARGTAYLFPRLTADLPDQQVALALKGRAGLVVNPGYQFGPRGVGHIRICFAQAEDAWEKALERIVETLDALVADGS